jgi:hypothetical protein
MNVILASQPNCPVRWNRPSVNVSRQVLLNKMVSVFLTARPSSGFWNVNLVWFILSGEFMAYYIVWDTHAFALVHNTKKPHLRHSKSLKKVPRIGG